MDGSQCDGCRMFSNKVDGWLYLQTRIASGGMWGYKTEGSFCSAGCAADYLLVLTAVEGTPVEAPIFPDEV